METLEGGHAPAWCGTLRTMTHIRTYATRVEAELARIALHSEGITATIVGVDVAMEGGGQSVRLLVPNDQVAAAEALLGNA